MKKKKVGEYKPIYKLVQLKVQIPSYVREGVRERVKTDNTLGTISQYIRQVLEKDLNEYNWLDGLKTDILDIIRTGLDEYTRSDKLESSLSDLTNQVLSTLDLVKAESMGVEQSIRNQILRKQVEVIYLISTSKPIPSDDLALLALQELISTGLVQKKDDHFLLVE